MHDADKKITITEDGMINLKSLKELYDPSPPIIPQQNTYIKTHGHNSPAAGHDVTLRDIKSNEESEHSKELAKEQLTDIKPNRWYRHWGFIVAVILLLMGLVTLLLMLRS